MFSYMFHVKKIYKKHIKIYKKPILNNYIYRFTNTYKESSIKLIKSQNEVIILKYILL